MYRLAPLLLVLAALPAMAGGGLVLQNDTCILTIGFYEAHFTAYQTETSGDEEFCENLPAHGKTIFVLDYLHQSLKVVPVDFRIIRNVTGKGEFARVADVNALADMDAVTDYYQPPTVNADGRLLVEHTFAEDGDYIGIVTAGHPTNDRTYVSVFPFRVGISALPWGWIALGVAVLLGGGLLANMHRIGSTSAESAA